MYALRLECFQCHSVLLLSKWDIGLSTTCHCHLCDNHQSLNQKHQLHAYYQELGFFFITIVHFYLSIAKITISEAYPPLFNFLCLSFMTSLHYNLLCNQNNHSSLTIQQPLLPQGPCHQTRADFVFFSSLFLQTNQMCYIFYHWAHRHSPR